MIFNYAKINTNINFRVAADKTVMASRQQIYL